MSCSFRRSAVVLRAIAFLVAVVFSGSATAQTWTGYAGDNNWNSPLNWDTNLVPNSPTATAMFTDSGAPSAAVNIASIVTVQSLMFANPTNYYIISAAPSQTLTVSSIATNAASAGAVFYMPSVSTGSILFPLGGNLNLSNDNFSYGSGLQINSGVIGTTGNGGVNVSGGGFTAINFGVTFAPSPNAVSGGLTKTGPGYFEYGGDGTNLAGGLTLNGGLLVLDYSYSSTPRVGSGALTLAGGTLALYPPATFGINGSFTQTFSAGTIVSAGHTEVIPYDFGAYAGSLVMAMGAVIRSAGATVDINDLNTSVGFVNYSTTTGNTNGLFGSGPAYATVNGTTWLTVLSDGFMTGLGGNSYGFDTYTPNTNVDVTMSAALSSFTANSLRFGNNRSSTLTLSGTNTLQSGGILVTPTGGGMITGGTLTASNSGEIIVHQWSPNPFTINSFLVSSVGLTKTGPGTLILGCPAGDNITGPININMGNLTLTSPFVGTVATAINFNDNSGNYSQIPGQGIQTLTADFGNFTNFAIYPPIMISSAITYDYGTYFSTGASTHATVKLLGVLSSAPGSYTSIRFTGEPTNTSGFLLGYGNTFTGNIGLQHGSLTILGDSSLGDPTNTLILEVGDAYNGGLVLNDNGASVGFTVAHPIVVNATTRIVTLGNNQANGPDTYSGSLTGTAALIKAGPGTLTIPASAIAGYHGNLTVSAGTLNLTGDNSAYPGSVTVSGGTLAVATDISLPANLNVNGLGTLQFTTTTDTNRSLVLNGGILSVSAGHALNINGGQVINGYLNGPGNIATYPTNGAQFGNVTIRPSATVTSASGFDVFLDVTNSGTLNVVAGNFTSTPVTLNGFTNQGSGTIVIGVNSAVAAAEFQSYGTLTINAATAPAFTQLTNAGSTPLYFNGGSRTMIGTAATAGTFTAGIDLHGQNAVVAGGLFVNNGYVVDSTSNGAVVVADYGALVKGAGFYQYSPLTQNGGRVQAGNSPGSASFGQLTFGPGGVSSYVFAIDDAMGTAGPTPNATGQVSGWGLMKAVRQLVGTATTSGDFAWTADATNKLTFAIDTLVNPTTVGTDVIGPMADFDPSRSYSWQAVQWAGTYTGPTDAATLDAATNFDTSGFENPIAGTFGWSLSLSQSSLSLTYTPSAVPEPGTLALVGLAAAAGWRRRRR